MSQGFYGRLLRSMEDQPENAECFLEKLEAMNFKDAVDLIMYIES